MLAGEDHNKPLPINDVLLIVQVIILLLSCL